MEKKKLIYLIALIAVLAFAFGLRLIYFNSNEAVWWDEADYLAGAKKISGVELDSYEFNPKRPFFLSLFWGFFLWLGANDAVLHFTVLLFSLLAVYITYLLGKDMYGKETGLIAAFFMSALWLNLFFMARLLTDVPAATFFLLSAYFFWKGYHKKDGKDFALSGLFFGLNIFTRAASLVNIVPLVILTFLKEKFSFLKNKKFWMFVIAIMIIFAPYIIWLFANYENPLGKFIDVGRFTRASAETNRSLFGDIWNNFNIISYIILAPFSQSLYTNFYGFLVMLLLIVLCLDVFIGYDLIFKNEELKKKIFLLVWAITPYLFFTITSGRLEDRYLMAMFPAFFILIADGLMKLNNFLKNYYKYLGWIAIALICFLFAFYQIKYADDSIKSRAETYAEVAKGGLWIKQNSNPSDVVITASTFQNMYYSERNTYPFPKNVTDYPAYLEEKNPRYVIVNVFEPGFTPQWAYSYQQENPELFTPVQGYVTGNNEPLLVIYQYNKFIQ